MAPALTPCRTASAALYRCELINGQYGPGTRLVLFTAGCPLRCVYCHRPATWSVRSGHPVDADQVMRQLPRYAPLFELTGGGVTLSGGEPLLHADFVTAVVGACRAEGVHVTLDTAGAVEATVDDDTLAALDLVLLDLKAYDVDTYWRTTRGDVGPGLRLAERLAGLGRPIWLSFVLVPGLTDVPGNVERLADFAAGLGTVARVDVVPFHRGAESGWASLGLRFPLQDHPGPTREALDAVRRTFRSRGLTLS